ncbi:MAG: hypothetical protein ACR2OG_10615 [Gemmatimonadaceae bacterium]
MLLERCVVSRKTPRDGKLEITEDAATIMRPHHRLVVELRGTIASARLDSMTCGCRGSSDPHIHYFLEAELLKSLRPEAHVALEMAEATGTISVIEERS